MLNHQPQFITHRGCTAADVSYMMLIKTAKRFRNNFVKQFVDWWLNLICSLCPFSIKIASGITRRGSSKNWAVR